MLKLAPLLAVLCLPLTARADSADTLVDLVRPHVREVQTLTFLSKINPFGPASPAAKECDMSRLQGALRALFAEQYRQGLSPAERDSAIEFFGSELGRSVVEYRFRREGRSFDAAVAKQAVEEGPDYPKPLADALVAFLKTGAGSKFVDDGVEKTTEPGASAIGRTRADALEACATASRRSIDQRSEAQERQEQPVKRDGASDLVPLLLGTVPSADQVGFAVDIYPGTPTCETRPVPVVRQSFEEGTQPTAERIEVQRLKPLSFVVRATYAGGGACSPGAMTFVPMPDEEYTARLLNKGKECWVELTAREADGRVQRVPVKPKPLKVSPDGRHSCDWAVGQ